MLRCLGAVRGRLHMGQPGLRARAMCSADGSMPRWIPPSEDKDTASRSIIERYSSGT